MCPSKLLRATACAALIAFMPACSAMLVTPLDHSTLPSSEEKPRCTSIAAAPLADAMVAVLGVAVAAIGVRALAGEDTYGSHGLGTMAIVTGGLVGVTFGGSAYGGFSDTGECAIAQRKWDEAHVGAERARREHPDYLP
jgi:hypothetical protein